MPTYADELRRLANLLDEDFDKNLWDVEIELSKIHRSLFKERTMGNNLVLSLIKY